MKRAIALLLVPVICLSLCSCGKSDAVKAVEEQINTLNTPVSYDLLGDAIKSYKALSEEEKQKVENYSTLAEYSLKYTTSKLESLSKLCISSMELLASAWSTSIELSLEGRINYFADTYMEIACNISREELLDAMVRCNLIDTVDEYDTDFETIAYHLQNPASVIKIVKSLLRADGVFDTLLTETIRLQSTIGCLDENSKYYDTIVEYYADVCEMYEYLKSPSGSFVDLGDMIEDYSKGISAYNAKLSIT